MHNLVYSFDTAVASFITGWPPELYTFFLIMTWLGWGVITVAIGLAVVIWGAASRNLRLAMSGAVIWATLCIGLIIKHFVARDRPLIEYAANLQIDHLNTSFPSGHTTGAVVAYGLLAYLLAKILPRPWSYIIAAALCSLIILISISRIYLEVHFPSDVVAGALLGGAGLAFAIFIVRPRPTRPKKLE